MLLRKFILLILLGICSSGHFSAQISLEKIWGSYEYLPERVPGFKFMKDGRHYTRLVDNRIEKYDLTTGALVEVLLDANELDNTGSLTGRVTSYEFSDDEELILLESSRESIYRRSSKAYFYIYNRLDESLSDIRPGDKIMHATVSPDGKKIAYVFENNIYYKNLEDNTSTQVSSDGVFNKIINGSADWVYEEEFSFSQAFFWSPDSKMIAYQRFDESEVKEFIMTNYKDELYPEYERFKYPKVGEKNSVVSVHIYDLESKSSKEIVLDDEADDYIPRIKWTGYGDRLFIYHLNRHQNHLQVFSVDASEMAIDKVIDETNKYYIDITDDIRFINEGSQFIWSSEKSGYNHLYLHMINGEEVKALTSGSFDVSEFYGVDESNGTLYYQAAEKSPLQRHIYKVELDGKNKSCIDERAGTHSAQFSSTFDYYVLNYSTINTPGAYTIYDKYGKLVRQLEDNKALGELQVRENCNAIEFFDFTSTDGTILNGYLLKPANIESGKKYPVLMYVYGGPGSQNVTDSWKGQNYWWFQMLAQQGYVVACVDNRGTGARGEEFKKMTYLNLGFYETMDQIEAAKYLGSLDFVDSARIGIFGWSYGGYMSSLCILKGHEVFKAAIAVAPVTNWKWYDTIYTERYMRTEEENEAGYEENSPVNFAHLLEGNYLIVHGMGDDNVHFQHTAEMVNALVRENKQFDTYFYPNRNHGISGGSTRLHLYQKMTDFLNEKL